MTSSIRPAPKPRPPAAAEGAGSGDRRSSSPSLPAGEHAFSDEQKDRFQGLAASLSFVGASTMLFGAMAGLFAIGALYAGYAANGVALLVAAGVHIAAAWWTVSAGRALSSMVTTRGRDVERLMQAVEPLRRLFGFVRASIIVLAVGLVCVAAVIVWCTMGGDKSGRCPVGWW
jgi:hypothetical protein